MPLDDAVGGALGTLMAEVERLKRVEEQLRAENDHLLDAQRLLEENRDQYSDLFDLAPIAWLTLDEQGIIKNLNLAAMTLLGFGRGYLIGTPLAALLRSDDRRRFLDHLLASQQNELLSCEARLLPREGAPIPVRLSTRRTKGTNEGHAITLLDLREREAATAERKRLTAAEREARTANEAKDQFIAMLSHELRTPLTPVLAAASALAELEDLPEEIRHTLAIVQRNVTTEAQLIDDLLDITRIAHGKLRVAKVPVDAHRALGEALELLSPELASRKHELSLDLTAEHFWVEGDATRLQQVFWNLLRNSIKFTPPGGQIAVRTWNSGERLLAEVSDNGRGIDVETMTRLFRPFEQAFDDDAPSSVRGLGLGLPICRGILNEHGATIVASSQGRGRGSRFVIEIGTIDRPTLVPSAPPSTPPAPGRSVRILLVEDHEDTADIFERLLRRGGYEVQVANSVQSALAVSHEAFDVLLSDVGLADGSGHDLMRSLRKTRPVKGIALSGYGTEEDVRASKEAGFSAHITKPVNFGALLEAIASLSHRH